jgi:hypothetical protein
MLGSNGRRIGNYLERCDHEVIEVQFRHLPRETERNHDKIQSRHPLCHLRFEPSTSRILLQRYLIQAGQHTACPELSVVSSSLKKVPGYCHYYPMTTSFKIFSYSSFVKRYITRCYIIKILAASYNKQPLLPIIFIMQNVFINLKP